MEIYSGTIISERTGGHGYWYSISSHPVILSFYSKSDIFSLFEECEIAVEKRNNSYFLADFNSFSEIPPLKKNPENLMIASWLSTLVSSFHSTENKEALFIEKCRKLLYDEMSIEKLCMLENEYLEVSGFGNHKEPEQIIYDCFPHSKRLRDSIIKQLLRKRLKK